MSLLCAQALNAVKYGVNQKMLLQEDTEIIEDYLSV